MGSTLISMVFSEAENFDESRNAALVFLFLLLPVWGGQGQQVSLNYTNADLVPVLKKLARDAGMNIFLSPEVKGRVTISIKNVSANSAMDLILALQEEKYSYKVLKNTYVVATPQRLNEIPDDLLGR